MIKATHLHKQYGNAIAVSDVSFEVESGKVTGFLGPNGAGKSTTMRLMLGLDNGGGSTSFGGKQLHKYPEPAKLVGIQLEAKAFHPTRTPRNHLKIMALEGGVPLSRVDEVLDLVGLSEVAKRKPGKFSLGMSQRLGIAAAILAKPKYLLLDEPANGLDPEGIVWLRKFLKTYADDGNAVFVSSHLLSEMSLMADNVIVIGRGKLIANTSIKELIAGNAKSAVFVRTPKLAKLEALLKQQSMDAKLVGEGLEVTGTKTDEIGKFAFTAGIPLLELASHTASLEDVFLELTENAEEFRAKGKGESQIMMNLLKAELRKVFTVRSTYFIIAIVVLLELLFAFYITGWRATPADLHNPATLANAVTSAISAISIFSALIALLLFAHEYRYNTIMYTLTASNSRSKVLLAKILVISGFAILFTLIFGAMSPLLTLAAVHAHHLKLVPQTLHYWDLLWRCLFFGWGYAMAGLVITALIRNQVGAIIILFVVPGTLEGLLGLLLKSNTVYLPFSALHQVIGQGTVVTNNLSTVNAALVFSGYLVVTWAAAWVLFLRRDAN